MTDSLQNLTETLQKFEIGKASFAEISKEFISFFERLNSLAEKISADNKEEYAMKLVDTLNQLAQIVTPYIEVIPLEEENLLLSLDNPSYFDVDHWKNAQEAKERLGELARRLLPFLAVVPLLEESQKSPTDKKKHLPRAPKSRWLKS